MRYVSAFRRIQSNDSCSTRPWHHYHELARLWRLMSLATRPIELLPCYVNMVKYRYTQTRLQPSLIAGPRTLWQQSTSDSKDSTASRLTSNPKVQLFISHCMVSHNAQGHPDSDAIDARLREVSKEQADLEGQSAQRKVDLEDSQTKHEFLRDADELGTFPWPMLFAHRLLQMHISRRKCRPPLITATMTSPTCSPRWRVTR